MDLQTLSQLFATTYNADPNIRKAAELEIRRIGNEEGMIGAVLRIIAADTIDSATRQACSVWLKNRVYKSYALEVSRSADQTVIVQSDREALRINILPLLAASPSRGISLQLASALRTIISHDFPAKWHTLIGEIKNLLLSSNVREEVHAGCIAALEAVRAFRFRQKSDIIPRIVVELFPTLVSIATQMIQTPPSSSQEIPTMLHLILKTYRTSIIVNLSEHQQRSENLVQWCQLFFGVINLRLSKESVPDDEEERQKCEWWKAKKWAYADLGRLFHRFGNPSQLPRPLKSTYSDFAEYFVSTFAPQIFNAYLHQVELFLTSQEWLSSKCQYQIFQFFTECVKPKSTWILIKPHFESLVSTFIFPQLSFNDSRKALWEDDPVDYVRMSVDEYESYSTPVSAATTFLFSLVSNRTKTTFLPILGFINSVLRAHGPAEHRFGALNMTAALGPHIMRHPDIKNNMEHFMLQFVSPELSSPEPYLRAIALEIIGTVTKNGHVWSTEALLSQHTQAVASALDDAEIPVKVQAALTLTEMVTAYDSVRTAVAPQIGKVVHDILTLSDETDLDILNNSMEVMAEQFQTELLPVAAFLTARLCDSFLRLAKETVIHEQVEDGADLEALVAEGDDDTFAAMSVSKTIGTIVASIDSAPEILAQVQEIVIPIIVFTFENKLLDLFQDMYDLIDSLTYKLRTIAPSMWPVFELTYKLFKHEAIDFLDEMLPALDNFVSFGADVIKSRPDYTTMLVDIYTESITNEKLGQNDSVNGSKLAECLLLHLRGGIDDKLQLIINTSLSILDQDQTQTTYLRLTNLQVLINSILYNPSAALHFMEAYKPNTARSFFDRWFVAINHNEGLPRVHDKKLSILALCALLEMMPDAIPDALRDGWPGIVGGILKIFKGLPKAIENRRILLLKETEDQEDEDEGNTLNLTENDDDVWDDDSAYMELLVEQSARLREKAENMELGEEDSDSDDEDDVLEELSFMSPLDNVNPYTSFKQALTTFQMQDAMGYQASTTVLDIEQQTMLMEVMRIAEQGSGSLS